jgi:hypothetical protein
LDVKSLFKVGKRPQNVLSDDGPKLDGFPVKNTHGNGWMMSAFAGEGHRWRLHHGLARTWREIGWHPNC